MPLPKGSLWIIAPLAVSAGVLFLSAQSPQGAEGVKVGELADKVQVREKAVAQKEAELRQMEDRLNTLQGTLDRDRADLQNRERSVQEATAKLEALRTRPPIDPHLIQTYEKMDPIQSARAMKELAGINREVSVSLLAGMAPKKAALLLDQLTVSDAKLSAVLSEKVGLTKPKE